MSRVTSRTLALVGAIIVGVAVVAYGLWVPDHFLPVFPSKGCGLPDCHVDAHFEPAYLDLPLVLEGVIAGVATFLVIAALRWAWRSYR